MAPGDSRRWKPLYLRHAQQQIPVYRILVPQSVPDSVRERWRARGLNLSAGAAHSYVPRRMLSRNLTRRGVIFHGTVATGVGTTGVVGLGAGGLVGVGAIDALGAVATSGTVAGIATVLVGVTGLRHLRDPKRLRASEREAAAGATWITPASFGYSWSKRGVVNPEEQQLFQTLVAISRKIVATRSWTHPLMQGDSSRLDLDHVVGTIGVRLAEIGSLRSDLLASRDADTAPRVDRYLAKLDEVFASLAGRVADIDEYLQRLGRLDLKLGALEHEEQSRVLGDRVLDVLARTADDDAAQWELQDLHLMADSHAEAISQLIGELRTSADALDDFPGDQLDRELARQEDLARANDRETPGNREDDTRPL